MASIRVNDELYRELNKVAGELRVELGRPVPLEEVLARLLEARRLKLGDLAGAWKMSDREAEEILRGLKGFWSNWKYPRE